MNGKEVAQPTNDIRVMTLESNGRWLKPNQVGPRRAAEVVERALDPEQLAVAEIVRAYGESLEQAKASLGSLEGLGYDASGANVESAFWSAAESMLDLLDQQRERTEMLQFVRLPAEYLDMEDQVIAEGERRAGHIVAVSDYKRGRQVAGLNNTVDESRGTAERVGPESKKVSAMLTSVTQQVEKLSRDYKLSSEAYLDAHLKVKADEQNGRTDQHAREWKTLLKLREDAYEDIRFEIIKYMAMPLLETTPEWVMNQVLSDDAEQQGVYGPYIDAERVLYRFCKKGEAYLAAPHNQERASQAAADGAPVTGEVDGAVEPYSEITDAEMNEFLALVEPIARMRQFFLAERAVDEAFAPIDRSQEVLNQTAKDITQGAEKMNVDIAQARSVVYAERTKLHEELNELRNKLGVGANMLSESLVFLRETAHRLHDEELDAAKSMQARRVLRMIASNRDVTDIAASLVERRSQLIEMLAMCAPGQGNENLLAEVLDTVAARRDHVANFTVTDGVTEEVINQRTVARGRNKGLARGEAQPTNVSQKQQKALGRRATGGGIFDRFRQGKGNR